ncbi:cellulose binding domain-containing protein, partial [Anaeromicropila populeti]
VTPTPVVTPTPTAVTGVKPVVKVTSQFGNSVNQQYSISAAGTESVDFSKLTIRYYYSKTSTKPQTFWCDNAGLQLNVDPWYVSLTSKVNATFEDGYMEITFDSNYQLAPGTGTLALGVRFAQSDWSAYTDFVDNGVKVFYDGTQVG